jgi:hypothetical protein
VDSAIALESDWPATNVFSAAWTTRTASIPDAATRITARTQVIRPAPPRYQETCQILGLKKIIVTKKIIFMYRLIFTIMTILCKFL